eukprot:gene18189-biopygen5395
MGELPPMHPVTGPLAGPLRCWPATGPPHAARGPAVCGAPPREPGRQWLVRERLSACS